MCTQGSGKMISWKEMERWFTTQETCIKGNLEKERNMERDYLYLA